MMGAGGIWGIRLGLRASIPVGSTPAISQGEYVSRLGLCPHCLALSQPYALTLQPCVAPRWCPRPYLKIRQVGEGEVCER